ISKLIISTQETLKESKEDTTKEDKNPFISQEKYNELNFNPWIDNCENNTFLNHSLEPFPCFLQPSLEKQENKQQLSIINNNFFIEIIPKQEIKKKKTKKKQKQTTSTTISVQQFYFYLEESKRIFKLFKRGINLSRVKQMIKSAELIFSLGFIIPTCLQKLYSTLIQVYNSLLKRKLSQRLEKKLATYMESCKQLQLNGAITIQ
ncbi:10888_t:CDS:1, partial [Racocetra fulgida]